MELNAKSLMESAGIGLVVGSGARLLGKTALRTVSAIGWGITVYSGARTLQTYFRNDPHNQLAAPLLHELELWKSAISCIGRDPYSCDITYSIFDGGAIAFLSERSLARLPGSIDDRVMAAPDPAQAKDLVRSARHYLRETREGGDEEYKRLRSNIAEELRVINSSIPHTQKPGRSYASLQERLSTVTGEMKVIESAYQSQIWALEEERNLRRLKYLALAGASALVGGLAGKKA